MLRCFNFKIGDIRMYNVFDICSDVELIFKGGQKEVYKAFHPKYGIVILKKGKFNSFTALERAKREVNFLQSIHSQYYPKNFEFTIDENAKNFYIVEEFIESKKITDLKNYFNSEEKIINLLKQLINGLKILWNNNIVHRDLKPDNILITKNFIPKIIDLGIARFLDYESLTNTIATLGPCTPIYASPEQLLNKKKFINMRTDFFSLGIIILEMHLGFHPFHPKKVGNNKSIPENIVNCLYVNPSDKEGTSKNFIDLIDRLLKVEPYQRFRNYKIFEQFLNVYWSI